MTNETREALSNAILQQIIREGGQDSVSSILNALRFDGWKNLGSNATFETVLKNLGFTLVPVYKKSSKPSGFMGRSVVKTLVTV